MIMKNFHVKFGNKQMQFYSLRFQIWLLFACQECTKTENYNYVFNVFVQSLTLRMFD